MYRDKNSTVLYNAANATYHTDNFMISFKYGLSPW